MFGDLHKAKKLLFGSLAPRRVTIVDSVPINVDKYINVGASDVKSRFVMFCLS